MASFVLRAAIAAAPDAVFAVLTDPASQPRLFPGSSPDVLVGPGPLRSGSRLKRSRTLSGNTFAAEATVEVHRPPKEFSVTGESRGVRIETRWRLTPTAADGNATNVEYECRIAASGLASLFEGAILDALKKADTEHLERLRALVETRVA